MTALAVLLVLSFCGPFVALWLASQPPKADLELARRVQAEALRLLWLRLEAYR